MATKAAAAVVVSFQTVNKLLAPDVFFLFKDFTRIYTSLGLGKGI